jgi:hypothetical protein
MVEWQHGGSRDEGKRAGDDGSRLWNSGGLDEVSLR